MRSPIDRTAMRSLTDPTAMRSLTDPTAMRSLTDPTAMRSLTDLPIGPTPMAVMGHASEWDGGAVGGSNSPATSAFSAPLPRR